MYFCAMGEATSYDKEGHFLDDWADWVHTYAPSFAEAKEDFERMTEDVDDNETMSVSDPKVRFEGSWYNLDELGAKLGMYLEPSTDLDALLSEMEQAKAESAIEDEYIAMEQRMLHGKK